MHSYEELKTALKRVKKIQILQSVTALGTKNQAEKQQKLENYKETAQQDKIK